MGLINYKNRLFRNIRTVYKKWDIYARDLTLTFQGDDKHTTYVGATLTISIILFMLIYAAFQLEVMFKRQRTTVNVKNIHQDLTLNYDNISLYDLGFDFAVQLGSRGNYAYDETYFKLEIINVNSWWETNSDGVAKRFKTKNYLDLHTWTDFKGTPEEISRLGINTTYFWPKEKDFSIGGAFSSPNYRYVQINLYKWQNGTSVIWKPQDEIDQYLGDARLSFAYRNFYFDSDDYVEPVKSYIDDKVWFKVMPDRLKNTDVLFRKNYVKLQDKYFQVTGEQEEFFMSIPSKLDFFDTIEDSGQLVGVYFRMDNIVDTYERQVYSSGDLLAQVGGIYSFLRGIGAVLVFVFSERLLVSALAGKLYQVYDEKKNLYHGSRYDKNSSNFGDDLNRSSTKLNNTSNKIYDSSAIMDDEESKFYQSNPIRNLYKSTLYWRNKSGIVSKKLKTNKRLDEVDRQSIKNMIINRKRFNYNSWHVLQYLICCIACRQRRSRKWKTHLLYNQAKKKVYNQLDVVNILRWIEQLKLLSKVLLNHKQKFWLKFQKEHLLELDANSEEEKKRLRKEKRDEDKDFIKGLQNKDPKIVEKVVKMLRKLEYENRSNIDQKIIQGLFEEYVSDSDEEDKVHRVMNTEEEQKEFYSLALPEPVKRKKQFNKSKKDDLFDLTSLRNLYHKEDNLFYLGKSSRISKATSFTHKTFNKAPNGNVEFKNPLEELTERSKPTQFKRKREASIKMKKRNKVLLKRMTQNPRKMMNIESFNQRDYSKEDRYSSESSYEPEKRKENDSSGNNHIAVSKFEVRWSSFIIFRAKPHLLTKQ